jgi:hypothetical protein
MDKMESSMIALMEEAAGKVQVGVCHMLASSQVPGIMDMKACRCWAGRLAVEAEVPDFAVVVRLWLLAMFAAQY